jgi:hypothetical protein
MIEEIDIDGLLGKIVLLQRNIQTLVKDSLQYFSDEELRYAIEVYGAYLNYPLYKDFVEVFEGDTDTVMH